jgi:8-oxo-dGTP pyrophosphatase MutT (NUDIX family)/phosphohistidine phosphatase SixA
MPVSDAAADGWIRAAGAVLWRPGRAGSEVALVHRPRYDDWSLPKGKRNPGEHELLTAVREVAEETGVQVVLGRRLRSTRYERDGVAKVVDYWAARSAAAEQAEFRPNDEVDVLEWLPVPAARRKLSYPRDTAVLDDFAAGPADTAPCILLRHASAGSRTQWYAAGHEDDLPRPLDAAGIRAAEALADLLSCYAPGRVISSAAERCVATVRPFAVRAGAAIEIEPALTVGQPGDPSPAGAGEAGKLIAEVVDAGGPAVLCGHRENLPALLDQAAAQFGGTVPDGPPLRKGEFWALHTGAGVLASAERHRPVVT